MLTRNKKKCIAEKDKSCPENSNQQYFVVPSNNVVDMGEMVTMDHNGTSGGRNDDCQRMDYLHVANDLMDSDKGKFLESGLRSLLDLTTSNNVISVDLKMFNPVIWGTLLEELLHLILARLPVPNIIRLRSLSKKWRRDMDVVNSGIYEACEEASSTMVALVLRSSRNVFFVTICDVTKCNSLYAYHLHLRRPRNDGLEEWPYTWTIVDACDGGLVCFMSVWKSTNPNQLSIIVVNLLTRVQHELPPLHYKTLPTMVQIMVQIKVNLDTKCYKVVVVVGASRARNLITIETYDSGTRQWTKTSPPWGSIFGPIYNWVSESVRFHSPFFVGVQCLGACDFDEGKFYIFNAIKQDDSWQLDTAVEKNQMFVLWELGQDSASYGHCFFITEYHFENQTKAWVKGKSYECPCFEDLIVEELFAKCLYACDGFLMIVLYRGEKSPHFRLFELSTNKWSEWSNLPKDSKGWCIPQDVLCKAHWNVIP